MTETQLRSLYRGFVAFRRRQFARDAPSFFGVDPRRLDAATILQTYENYYRQSFFGFLGRVKAILCAENVFDVLRARAEEDWELWAHLQFLADAGILGFRRDGAPVAIQRSLLRVFPQPRTEAEIRQAIERRMGVRLRDAEPVADLFRNFTVKAQFDQLPISQGSAVFVVRKILEYLPYRGKFLFVGDDDFVSVLLGLADPSIPSVVIDADEHLLATIAAAARRFRLPIETRRVDIRKRKTVGGTFCGFLANPVYTEKGVRAFVQYAVRHLGKDGGVGFLEVGDEAIGHRFLFLQEFFAKQRLVIRELTPGRIVYPHRPLHPEDRILQERFEQLIGKKAAADRSQIGAALYVFEYVPFAPKRNITKQPFYAYL